MHHLGFGEKMRIIIMSCLKFVSYSILLNLLPVGSIKPSRRLRQGDPLSPCFFCVQWGYKVYCKRLRWRAV